MESLCSSFLLFLSLMLGILVDFRCHEAILSKLARSKCTKLRFFNLAFFYFKERECEWGTGADREGEREREKERERERILSRPHAQCRPQHGLNAGLGLTTLRS